MNSNGVFYYNFSNNLKNKMFFYNNIYGFYFITKKKNFSKKFE